ncbi:hypothetical protein CVT24_005515 [Panaeolus cyanescens]|uniref:Fungal-type protein kinase domain-containing protein n=1 Tax=Panaeolus cyanescens TaxID=181874 RepID=A0A409YC00_9AGAR|nr:hypothetical protein CVT24_005515 [Panaeolus cyanescens]
MLADELAAFDSSLSSDRPEAPISNIQVSDEAPDNFIQDSDLYSNDNRQWTDVPLLRLNEFTLYGSLQNIFPKILEHRPFFPGIDPSGPPRMAHSSHHSAAITTADRFLYRTSAEALYCDTVDKVPEKLAFLQALRSAIQAHRDVYITGNYIHRDISINNILYPNSEKKDPNIMGYLMDFDLRVSPERIREENNSRRYFRTGTHAFQSIASLDTQYYIETKHKKRLNPPLLHDHLDDLESFIWVFRWVTSTPFPQNQRSIPSSQRPINTGATQPELQELFQDSPYNASSGKFRLLKQDHVQLGRGWRRSEAISHLNDALFAFAEPVMELKHSMRGKRALSAEELLKRAPADYQQVLDAFDTAIEEMQYELGICPRPKRRGKGKSAPSKQVSNDGPATRLRRTSSKRTVVPEDEGDTRTAKRTRTNSGPQAPPTNAEASGSRSRPLTRSGSRKSSRKSKK